jgi:catechol 2,3-dioxygenase-like lactoylglutathione lyase family enzyme
LPRGRLVIEAAPEVLVMKLSALMVRYIVNDVDEAVAFYEKNLRFRVAGQSGPFFALLERENMQLVLSPPKGPGGGSQPMPDGRRPEPGGWNRIVVRTSDLDGEVDVLRRAGASFRNEVVSGPGVSHFSWQPVDQQLGVTTARE